MLREGAALLPSLAKCVASRCVCHLLHVDLLRRRPNRVGPMARGLLVNLRPLVSEMGWRGAAHN